MDREPDVTPQASSPTGKRGPLRLGIIGCGRVFEERHLPALRRIADVSIAAVCDSDPVQMEQAVRLTRADKTFSDYRALLSQADLDAVAVLTPTATHSEIGIAALQAGKHLFAEKPLALSLAECDRLLEAQQSSHRVALVCFNLRWHRLVRQARSLLREGRIGVSKAIQSAYTHNRTGEDAPEWHRLTSKGGGVLFNEAVHHFDLWRFLTGREILEVSATNLNSPVYENETSVVLARLEGAVAATGLFSLGSSPASELQIAGSRGRLKIDLYRFDGLEHYGWDSYSGDLARRAREALDAAVAFSKHIRDTRTGGLFQTTFVSIWRHFSACVRGEAAPECTLADGRQAVAAALAAVRSFQTGRPVTVSQSHPPEGT